MQNDFLKRRLFEICDFVDIFGVFFCRFLQRRELDVVEKDERHKETTQTIDDRQTWRRHFEIKMKKYSSGGCGTVIERWISVQYTSSLNRVYFNLRISSCCIWTWAMQEPIHNYYRQ